MNRTVYSRTISEPSSTNAAREDIHTAEAATRLRRRLVGFALAFIALSNLVVVVWLWLNGGGVSAVHTTGDLLTSVGRITGLVSAYLALIQILLLARLRPLEHLVGFDHLTVWHRLNGKVCLGLVLAHVVFITIGYALNDRFSVPHEAVTLLQSYPGMVAATFGTGLMIAVVISSFVIVRRRLPYEAWYGVHLTAYAAIALAWFHQIPTGNELTANAAAATYWTSLYVATVLILVLCRLFTPMYQAFRYQIQVVEVVEEGPDTTSIVMTGKHLDRLGAQSGQFFLWRFLSRGRWWESHPFSLSALPTNDRLRITVKNAGNFSREIARIKPGTRVVTEGPFGVFTNRLRRRAGVVLIAGGIGITPIRALVEQMTGDLVVLYRVMRDSDIVFRDELQLLAHERDIQVHYVVGDHRSPVNADLMSAAHLRSLVPDIRDRDVFVCGPPAMIAAIERSVRDAGVPAASIHAERFAL